MPKPDFPAFLARSLDVLRSETPQAYRALQLALAATPLRVEVDGHVRVLRFGREGHELSETGAAAGELRSDGATILALIDGELGLLDAILRDRLFLRGPVPVIDRFERALSAFLAGSVRAPGLPPLLHAYRTGIAVGRAAP